MFTKRTKYRIKIVTYKSGRQSFYPQVKNTFRWWGLEYYGIEAYDGARPDTREGALEIIDKHFKGNTRVQTIEFEYINR